MKWDYYSPNNKKNGALWCETPCELEGLETCIKSLEEEWNLFKPEIIKKVYFAKIKGLYSLTGDLFQMRKTKWITISVSIIIIAILLFLIYKIN